MVSRGPDMLSSVFSRAAPPLPGRVLAMKTPAGGTAAGRSAARRTAIFDMHHSVHCSIVGTCLPTAEIRRLLIKLGVPGAEAASDHDLHKQGVAIAGQAQGGGKLIQKALDNRHEASIRQFAKAKDEAALGRLWDEARKRGDIPGAYWALLSHPLASDGIMRRAFGDVHMLSHMVGAANRADIRRLCRLEQENAALQERLAAQQRQLRDGFTDRDATIRRLNEALGRALARAPTPPDDENGDARAAREALLDLERRLARETSRCTRLESRLATTLASGAQAESARRDASRECEELRHELALAEAEIRGFLGQETSLPLSLGSAKLLYVGGRAHQVPQLKAVMERAGGTLICHDGGIEHSMTLLPGLIGRADWVVFPVDCISHDAMGQIKRHCRLSGKPFVPLRTASLASLLAGVAMLASSALRHNKVSPDLLEADQETN